MAVHAFTRLMDEVPFVLDIIIDAGSLQGTVQLLGSHELEIPAGTLQATVQLLGSHELEIPAGSLQATAQLLGSFELEIPAGPLQATAQLLGSFELEIDAGPLIARARWGERMEVWVSLNPPSEDVKDILAAQSVLGLVFGTDLFIGGLPSTPDACVAVYDTTGEPPEPSYRYERPHVQVVCRGDQGAYRLTQIQAQTIRDILNGINEETWNGARYIGIWALGDVNFIANDENRRPRFTINFRLHRTGI